MVTKYGPPYFYVGLAEEEMNDPSERKELNAIELHIQKKIGRALTLTERRVLARCGEEELEKLWKC